MSPPDPPISFRTATPDDAAEISALHRSSILTACTSYYSAAQIRAWVGVITPEFHPAAMGKRRTRVAIDDGAVAGFSTTDVKSGVVNALYVAPFAMHRGIGQAMLADAEEGLLTAGKLECELHATANAVDFYAWLGYLPLGQSVRRLPGGVALTSTVMRRRLV